MAVELHLLIPGRDPKRSGCLHRTTAWNFVVADYSGDPQKPLLLLHGNPRLSAGGNLPSVVTVKYSTSMLPSGKRSEVAVYCARTVLRCNFHYFCSDCDFQSVQLLYSFYSMLANTVNPTIEVNVLIGYCIRRSDYGRYEFSEGYRLAVNSRSLPRVGGCLQLVTFSAEREANEDWDLLTVKHLKAAEAYLITIY
jgi:hypothetical protein